MTALHRWADCTSSELAALAARDAMAVWPLAAIEQHGAHLPLSTDADIAEGLLAAAVERLPDTRVPPLLILPTLAPAASDEHADFAGTLTMAPEAVIDTLVAVGASVARTGIRRLVLFNSHGGNRAAMDIAALRLRAAQRMLVAKLDYARIALPPELALPRDEQIHGGMLETALMLHLAPDKVRREAIKAAGDAPQGTDAARSAADAPRFAWLARDLSPDGIAGRPGAADAEFGARLCDHYAHALTRMLARTADFDLARLAADES